MWTAQSIKIDQRTVKTILSDETGVLTFAKVIPLWQDSNEFRDYFTAQVRKSPFSAFFWETPPVTSESVNREFEFVMVDGPMLSRLQPDPTPFEAHFSARSSEAVLAFPNLGGDAMLIVPAPLADETCYTHLSQFLGTAPKLQIHGFWRSAGLAMERRISQAPTWLSTAGLGVSWLHLRLDSRPKYYRHEPYKEYT